MKKVWTAPVMRKVPVNCTVLKDVEHLSDAELKTRLEEAGYPFPETDGVYRANPGYVLREIAGEAVLVSMGNGVADFCGVIMLNASAKVLWQGLQQGAGKKELIRSLREAFDVSEELAEEDVEKTLQLLRGKGLVFLE